MTDEKYLFKETEKERKRLARGAHNKRTGARKKGCKTPSDYLTRKERRELDGKPTTYNLATVTKSERWEVFKQMPHDVQALFEQNLIDNHGARLEDIANYLSTTVGNLRNWNFRHKLGIKPQGHKNMTSAWRRFIDVGEPAPEEVSVPVEEKKAPDVPSCAVKQDDILTVNNGEVFMTGLPAAVFEKAMMILDPSKRYCIRIGFFEEKLKEPLE